MTLVGPGGALPGDNASGQASAPAGIYTDLAAGGSHSCALDTAGTATCWGHDDVGQASPPPDTFVSIAAGIDHSCGIDQATSNVVCWGDNTYGQLNP